MIFGNLKIKNTRYFVDLNLREAIILLPLLLLVFYMGISPVFFIKYIHMACSNLTVLTSFL
jgi:NADH:ubiquinone oxidoreductase subunit 4 (subunit M)